MDDPFYIGYQPRAPLGSRRAVLRFLPLVGLLLVASAVLLARGQDFDQSLFEFGDVRAFRGTFHAAPVPLLLSDDGSALLLVGQGKHGASVPATSGSRVELRGTRIIRGNTTMVEVQEGSVTELAAVEPLAAPVNLGPVAMTGEIVGSKCFLGVMNPGRGPVHRACARHCIRGGVPAMLYSRNDSNAEVRVLLRGLEPDRMASMAALPVVVSGIRWRMGPVEWVEVGEITTAGS